MNPDYRYIAQSVLELGQRIASKGDLKCGPAVPKDSEYANQVIDSKRDVEVVRDTSSGLGDRMHHVSKDVDTGQLV